MSVTARRLPRIIHITRPSPKWSSLSSTSTPSSCYYLGNTTSGVITASTRSARTCRFAAAFSSVGFSNSPSSKRISALQTGHSPCLHQLLHRRISTQRGVNESESNVHHAVVSTFDLFSIGIGPSSSHTVGPMRAAKIFINDLEEHRVLDKVARLRIDVYGSLALTGVGHGTPNAILMGLEGEAPESVETNTILSRVEDMHITNRISLNGSHSIQFNPKEDMRMHYFDSLPQHPNGLRFTVYTEAGDLLATNEFFSIGGGFVVNEKTQVAHGENLFYKSELKEHNNEAVAETRKEQDVVMTALPFSNAEQLLKVCRQERMTIAQVVYENELQWRSPEEIKAKTLEIWRCMDNSIRNGCLSQETHLPGSIRARRRAPRLYNNLMRGLYRSAGGIGFHEEQLPGSFVNTANNSTLTLAPNKELQHASTMPRRQRKRMQLPALDYLSVYAIAVNEENAAGGRVVTAPTNGAAGVIPAVLKYYLEFVSDSPENDILEFLFTAAAIGMLYKRGASISAAEMGCQGEVGVACSMSAAGFAAVMGGTVEQIENAAEIGMEHNLGLTCDPVDGLVQIPCIERNALGAVKAVTAAQLALNEDGSHRVTLDQVIETMRQTGLDMQSKYKETSQGGLAVNVPVC
ncbi:serine dehydratase alpha chain-domain-containing protein [Syncephalis plumigaleata]|nr:serine dehydratase alpha chain-domain-containing protein [Syncephalis plumigaleata]